MGNIENGVRTTDFKGAFKMRNGRYCFPLTVQDAFSRCLVECKGLHAISIELAKPVFIHLLRITCAVQRRHLTCLRRRDAIPNRALHHPASFTTPIVEA